MSIISQVHLVTLTILFQTIWFESFGQIYSDTSDNHKQVFEQPEIPPIFPGEVKQFNCFLDENLDKEKLNLADTTGLIVAQFTIDTTGQAIDIKIIKSLDPIADEELLRVLRLMPKWIPGKILDKCVPVLYRLPFRLPYENKHCR